MNPLLPERTNVVTASSVGCYSVNIICRWLCLGAS